MSFFESEKSVIQVSGSALTHNLNLIKGKVDRDCQVMPVIKSDAYGHGILETARLFENMSTWGFGIYEMEEAAILRRSGIEATLFMLSGLLGEGAEKVLEFDLTLGVVSLDELEELESRAQTHGKRVKVHLKVDTGMSRFGMKPHEIYLAAKERERFSHLEFEGIYSHFACADEQDHAANERQLRLFKDVIHQVRLSGWHPRFIHMANSAAIMFNKESHFNLVRPGIAIYGALSRNGEARPCSGLMQAMSFSSQIVHIKDLPKGACISYGHTFRAKGPIRAALVPVGYDNGYMRKLSNSAEVLVKGRRCPVLGNVCMKTIVVDVTKVPDCRVGDEVVLMGEQGQEMVSAVELAQKASTISYELLCLLGKLNRRILLKG